jgi:phage shock protein PspC (stress-responsive transcriptional regulator)
MAGFCHRCGAGLPPGARFCSNCGTAIPVASAIPGRSLYRPIVGRQLAGVCLGIAQARGWDVAVVRILTVLCFFFSVGFVGVAYLACWIGIPEEPAVSPEEYSPKI